MSSGKWKAIFEMIKVHYWWY